MQRGEEKQSSSKAPDIDEERLRRALLEIASSPTKFCSGFLDFKPYPYQKEMLEDPSRFIVVCAGRRVGKSLVMSVKALWFAYTHPKSSTLIVAATQRQSMLMFDKLLGHIYDSPLLSVSVTRKTRTIIELSNGSRIVALPCGRYGKTLRGENADLVIIDEAAFVPEEVITNVMMPMIATTNGKMILLSTPYDKAHFFYKAFNSPRWSKYRFKTSDNPLVTQEYLDMQLESSGEKAFRQECLAEFVDDESTYFPMELLRPCVHVCESVVDCGYCYSNAKGDLSTFASSLYAGYDPGGLVDPAALVVVYKVPGQSKLDEQSKEAKSERRGEFFNPAFRVAYLKTYFPGKSAKQRQDQREISKDDSVVDVYSKFNVVISDIHKKYPFKKLFVDSSSIGTPIITHCRELGLPADGMNFHRVHKEELLSNLRILLERRKVELPDNSELLNSLNCITAERNRIGGYEFSHPRGTHDDLAHALALAVWRAGKGGIVIANIS